MVDNMMSPSSPVICNRIRLDQPSPRRGKAAQMEWFRTRTWGFPR